MDHHVLNLGAGVQSTTLYLFACDGELPIDVAIFADTGEEPAAVYRHLDWLISLKGPPILIRSAGKLGDDLIGGRNSRGGRFASIPAFTKSADGKVGMVRRQCTSEYKVEVVESTIRREICGLKPRQRMPKGTTVFQYFGFSTDEAARARRAAKRFEAVKWAEPVFPLLARNLSRTDCLTHLRNRVPHEVPKSACVFCPYKTNQDFVRMKATDPDSWQRAVVVDSALRTPGNVVNRGMNQPMYVHRSCVPLEMVDFSQLKPNTVDPMTVGECHGMCGL